MFSVLKVNCSEKQNPKCRGITDVIDLSSIGDTVKSIGIVICPLY